MFKSGKKTHRVQAYRCLNGHFFKEDSSLFGFSDSFIEYAVYVYLRCLSLNTTVDIIRATYEDDILTKSQVLTFIEQVGKTIPDVDDVDRLFSPRRSGYLAFDGVWFDYGRETVVLLVCFDPQTFDVISAVFNREETRQGYEKLIKSVLVKLSKQRIKGIYGDGDNGLIMALKRYFPYTPFQLCVVHKNLRMEQTVPVKLAVKSHHIPDNAKQEILEFSKLFHSALYADTKEAALAGLTKLLHFTNQHPQEKFLKAVNQLKHNFVYTLTHFDYPEMERDNNLIECFNGCLKPRLKLMRGFKKKQNLDVYLKLFLLEFRFHLLKESRFKDRRGRSPLELGGVKLPEYYNFLTLLRRQLHLSYQPDRT
jgi:hypothetical protein